MRRERGSDARATFDGVTASMLAFMGLCFVVGGLFRNPFLYLIPSLGTFGLVGVLHGCRMLRSDWRPTRVPFHWIHQGCWAFVVLASLPFTASAVYSAAFFLPAVGGPVAYYAFREAFSRRDTGFLSVHGFVTLVTCTGLLIVLVRLGVAAAGYSRDVLAWYVLAPGTARVARFRDHHLDLIVVLVFPIAMTAALGSARRGARWLAGLAASVMAVGIVLSFSRSAWLALVVEWVLLALIHARRRWRLLGVGMLVVAGALAVPGVWQRLATMVSPSHATNVQRLHMWSVAIELARRSPLVGNGLGTFGVLLLGFDTPLPKVNFFFPHNMFLHVACDVGLLGLALFVAWVVRGLSALRRAIRSAAGDSEDPAVRTAAAVLVSMAALLTFWLFDY